MSVMSDVKALSRPENVVVWTLTALTTVVLLLRIISRTKIVPQSAGWDDVVIVFSWVCELAALITFAWFLLIPQGNPQLLDMATSALVSVFLQALEDITPENTPGVARISIIAHAPALFAIAIPKLSVALLLIRLLNPRRWVRALILTLSTLCIVVYATQVVIGFLLCKPVAGQWDPDRYHPNCWSRTTQKDVAFFAGGKSVVTPSSLGSLSWAVVEAQS